MEEAIEAIEKELKPGEHLVWQSRPEKFDTLDKTYKKAFTDKIIISAVTAAVLILSYIFIMLPDDIKPNIYLIAAVIVFCALSPLSVFTYARRLRNKTVYAASNKRLFVYSGDLKTTAYEMIKTSCLRQDDDGHTTLLCGSSAVRAKPAKWRLICLFGLNDTGEDEPAVCQRFAFYALKDPGELKETLAPYFKID